MSYVYHVPPLPEDATLAERIAASNDEPDVRDWEFRRPILRLLPDRFSIAIAEQYKTVYQQGGRRNANLYLLDVKDELGGYAIKLAHRDDEVVALAKKIATHFAELRLRFRDPQKAVETLCAIAHDRYQVKPPLRPSYGNRADTVTVTVPGSTPPVTVTVSVTGTEPFM